MKDQKTDAGVQTIGKIYRDMNIDAEWSQISERGFTWWGHHYAQRIWADEPFDGGGILISRVNAETDYLRYPDRSAKTEDMLASEMQFADLSGPVIYRDTGRIKLRCSSFIHEQNQGWLRGLFSLAAVMQYVDVAFKVEEVASLLGLQPDKSDHPTSGRRPEMDGMLNIIHEFILPEGKKPFTAIPGSVFQPIADDLNNHGLFSTASQEGLTAYVPFLNDTALLEGKISEEHPSLGKGLLFVLKLPPEEIAAGSEIDGSLIMALNSMEQETSKRTGHFLGSWCLGPGRGDHKAIPVYVTFVPAVVCSPNVFANLVFATIVRCQWAESVFSEDYPAQLEQVGA